jgi:hypothetical protein
VWVSGVAKLKVVAKLGQGLRKYRALLHASAPEVSSGTGWFTCTLPRCSSWRLDAVDCSRAYVAAT